MGKSRGRLGIVACYPPPYGGVASEVVRLRPLLERRGVDYVVYNAVSESEDGVVHPFDHRDRDFRAGPAA